MRQIKFRAWIKEQKLMVDVIAIQFTEEWICCKHNGLKLCPSFDEINLLQFTGLTDKNGKEIYEGDIIKNYQADENEVFFSETRCGFFIRNYHDSALPLNDYMELHKKSEIIGNIYENPELLN